MVGLVYPLKVSTVKLVKENDLKVSEGAYVSGFAEKSSAKEAGLKEGDVVVKIDETPIKSSTAFIEYIGRHRPGDKVNMLVNRNGKEIIDTGYVEKPGW